MIGASKTLKIISSIKVIENPTEAKTLMKPSMVDTNTRMMKTKIAKEIVIEKKKTPIMFTPERSQQKM